jgi:tetratricopeptide (TPR) repeat protein
MNLYRLKRLAEATIPAALEKAERYRDLNQPEEAESICRDILDVVAEHPGALRVLGLALTDRFPGGWSNFFDEAIEVFDRLESEYDRTYYKAIAWERAAKAQLERGEAHNAVNSFEHALELFGRAERLGGPERADPILRWNRCVRMLTSHPALLAAIRDPRAHDPELGD